MSENRNSENSLRSTARLKSMSESSEPSKPAVPNRAESWIRFAHELKFEDTPRFVSMPPSISLSQMLDYCEELLARREPHSIMNELDRAKSDVEFTLLP